MNKFNVSKMLELVSVFSRAPNLIPELQKVLPNVEFHKIKDIETDAKLKESSILIGDFDLVGPHLYNLPPQLKWYQGTWAGVEKLLEHIRPNQPPPFQITRFSSDLYFGRLMSEYVVTHIVNIERDFFKVHENQLLGQWFRKGKITKHRAIFELTVGILGLGTIGNKIGQTLHFMGAKVYGFGRRERLKDYPNTEYISAYFTENTLDEMLKNCDYVVNVLPNTPETIGLLNKTNLESCKHKNTVLINIGRGTIATESDIVFALENRYLSGAVLDVFEMEPLSKDSPLWKLPQVVITPHVAGMSRDQDVAGVFLNNYRLFKSNQPLPNLIDFTKGY